MEIAKYQSAAHCLDDNKRLSVSLLGLVGEAGSVQSALKKRLITKISAQIPKDELAEELGDYLWYLASVCSLRGIPLRQIGQELTGTALSSGGTLSFRELQELLAGQALPGRADAVQALARTAIDIQQLLTLQTVTRMRTHGATLPALTDLMDLVSEALSALVHVATGFELNLDDIARDNLKKVGSLFEQGEVRRFDARYPPDEQIPRKFTVQFSEEVTAFKKRRVRLKINDVIVGDTLTDNVAVDDGYRFHDVFHLAFLAVLGWSPVTRSLLHRKRKSDASVDEIQDGARATIIEEAISLFLFQRRVKYALYKDVAQISHGLLTSVRELAKDLEVSICTAKEWQTAIHQGYTTFAELRKNQGGFITVDLDNRRLTYSPKLSKD